MAVTKIWAIHDSVSRVVDYSTNPSKTKLSDLEQVLLYAADKEKTLDEGEQQYAVTGIGCRAESAAREMAAVQRRFGKAGGNVAYHAYQSFKTGEVTAEECHRIGVETARRLWGNDRQVLVATHFNTGTYHNHFVVNPVNMWTGKKLGAKYEVYYKLRDMSDRVCKEHGLSVVKNPQRHKTARSVYFAEKDGEPTRYNLMRRALDEALTISSSWTELSAVLRKKGYVFVCDPYRRYATIRSLSAKKCMRTFRLGAEYDKEALQDRLLENQRDIRVTRRYFEFMRPYTREYARKNPPTEKYYRQRDFYLHLPRVTGYLSFFRCVAIVLGVAPLYEKEYRQPLSAECREACRRLDRFTAEITLVCREHLDTPEDVQRFLARMDKEMDAISAARSKIRNKQRGCADPVERVELKKSCAACTAELSRLRKQKQTAYNMIEDNRRFSSYWNSDNNMTYPLILAKIPVKNPWEIFAYLPFGGWNECPNTPELMAVAKYWFEQHGAVPAAMSHDELEFLLPAPVSEEKAMDAAVELYGFCPDVIDQGPEEATVGALADVLRQSTVWYFWWD